MVPDVTWRNLLLKWPKELPRQGMVVTVFQETIPFMNFLVAEGAVVLERDRPDATGARKVMLVYTSILAIKISNPMEMDVFKKMGFV